MHGYEIVKCDVVLEDRVAVNVLLVSCKTGLLSATGKKKGADPTEDDDEPKAKKRK